MSERVDIVSCCLYLFAPITLSLYLCRSDSGKANKPLELASRPLLVPCSPLRQRITEPQKNRTASCSSAFFVCTHFEENRFRIACAMAKTVCCRKILLVRQSHILFF